MAKVFNVSGACKPAEHYMVDLGSRLEAIRSMVNRGEYFAVNKARQYGKTTILRALAAFLKQDHTVISLDFQKMSSSDFIKESAFVSGLAREVEKVIRHRTEVPDQPKENIRELACDQNGNRKLAEIFECFSEWCGLSEKPVVLIIDEVDTAADCLE